MLKEFGAERAGQYSTRSERAAFFGQQVLSTCGPSTTEISPAAGKPLDLLSGPPLPSLHIGLNTRLGRRVGNPIVIATRRSAH